MQEASSQPLRERLSGRRIRRWAVAVVLVLLVVAGGLAWARHRAGSRAEAAAAAVPTFTVRRGPLTISVRQSGTLKAREQEIIKSQVEGQNTIIYLIPEGTRVKAGDLLVELDASKLRDQRVDQQLKLESAEAALIGARENLAVTKSQGDSDIAKAELAANFAKEDLVKYEDGEYPADVKKAESQITLAREELERATQKLEWTEKLFAEQYVAKTELDSDRLAHQRAQLEHELAQDALRLLKDFTYKRQRAQLVSDVEQTQMSLERTRRKASADTVQAEADLKTRESEHEQQKARLAKLDEQLAKTRIVAPVAGMVIYATSAQANRRGNTEPLAEGQSVFERQELIYLPTADALVAEVKIHESALQKVKVGMPARISVDALPGRTLEGKVTRIAPLPDPSSFWMNPDLKVFPANIGIEQVTPEVRSGMTCQAEIIVAQYDEATYVPLQAVTRRGSQAVVYVKSVKGMEARPIELGLDNNSMVHVLSGLDEGMEVVLAPPLAPGARPAEGEEAGAAPATATSSAPGAAPAVQTSAPPAAVSATEPPTAVARPDGDAAGTPPQGAEGARRQAPSAEQMAEWRKRMESMTPEEREKMRERRRPRDAEGGAGGSPAPRAEPAP